MIYPLSVAFPDCAISAHVDFESFSREAWDLIGRKIEKRRRPAETYAMAAESIGLPVSQESIAIRMFPVQLSRQLDLNTQREELDRTAQELLAENADFKRLQTLFGIGADRRQ